MTIDELKKLIRAYGDVSFDTGVHEMEENFGDLCEEANALENKIFEALSTIQTAVDAIRKLAD